MNKGIVSEIKDRALIVDIQCNEACAACSENHTCIIKQLTKKVTVPSNNSENYVVGQIVELEITTNDMLISMLWAYIMPLIIILSVLVISLAVGYSETISSLAALGSLAIYYIVLKMMNTKLTKSIKIHLK